MRQEKIAPQLRFVSSLEKCFVDECITDFAQVEKVTMLQNERLSLQLAYMYEDLELGGSLDYDFEVESPLMDHMQIRGVQQVPVMLPCRPEQEEFPEGYLRRTPGLYPDLLTPQNMKRPIRLFSGQLRCLIFTIENPAGLEPGVYPITVTAKCWTGSVLTATVEVEVLAAKLPEPTLWYTQWFYADCLSDYYKVPVFSQAHWQLIDNFMQSAAYNGINLLYTPILTPALDTLVGGERPTTQLVDVAYADGKYTFGFEKLDKWVEMARKNGIHAFEMAHLFTQWGAKHCPKVMVTENGETKRVFGWDTDSTGDAYKAFLQAFLPAVANRMEEIAPGCPVFWHISDEPAEEHLEQYRACKAMVKEILPDAYLMDALSDYNLYANGAVDHPVPSEDHMKHFLENKVPQLWTYHCCCQSSGVSNRFLAMPGARTRVIGAQMFKHDIVGFLQWGFNYYNNQYSVANINPYMETTGDGFVPAGDAFSVYPAPDGTAYDTLHGLHFYEGLQDFRAYTACAQVIGKEETVRMIEAFAPADFEHCLHTTAQMMELHDQINRVIAQGQNEQ